MTDRARLTYALLRTLLAWTPAPPASRTGVTLAQQQRGFVSKHRYLTCPDCLANGRPEGMRGCETCGGKGEIIDDGKDRFDDPPKLSEEQKRDPRRMAAGHGGLAREVERDRARQRDDELRRLEFQLAKPVRKVDEQADDVLTRSVALRDRMYRAGSYAELEAALARLRAERPVAYTAAMWVAYSPFVEQPVEPVRASVIGICEVLAEWMPDEIRVPQGVAVWTKDELAAQAAVYRERAAWRGRKDPLAVARRDDVIRRLAAGGLSQVDVAERVGVHPRTVARVLSRPLAA